MFLFTKDSLVNKIFLSYVPVLRSFPKVLGYFRAQICFLSSFPECPQEPEIFFITLIKGTVLFKLLKIFPVYG